MGTRRDVHIYGVCIFSWHRRTSCSAKRLWPRKLNILRQLTCEVRMQVTTYLGEESSHWEQRTAAQSVIVTRRMQPVSKTELLTEVVYGVTTELHPNSDFTENMHIYTKYTIVLYLHTSKYSFIHNPCTYYWQFRTPGVDQSYWNIYYNHQIYKIATLKCVSVIILMIQWSNQLTHTLVYTTNNTKRILWATKTRVRS